MSYFAVGYIHGGDVEDMLTFCDLISGSRKPYHAYFLEQELLNIVQLWPVFLHQMEVIDILKSSYRKSLRKHRKLKSIGPVPNRIRSFGPAFKMLRYRPNNFKTIITLDMNKTPALISVQGHSQKIVHELAKKVGIGPIFEVKDDSVLLPSEMLDLQFSVGKILQIIGK
jgi:hypothetical protein